MRAGQMRQRMGVAAVGMMDLTDENLAPAIERAHVACEALDGELRARGATITQRTAALVGAALSPLSADLQRRHGQEP